MSAVLDVKILEALERTNELLAEIRDNTKPKPKTFPCKKGCGTILKWRHPYKQGDLPVELNDKPHECPKATK